MMRPLEWDLQLRLKGLDRMVSIMLLLTTIKENVNLFQWVKKPEEMTLAHVEVGKNIKNAAVK